MLKHKIYACVFCLKLIILVKRHQTVNCQSSSLKVLERPHQVVFLPNLTYIFFYNENTGNNHDLDDSDVFTTDSGFSGSGSGDLTDYNANISSFICKLNIFLLNMGSKLKTKTFY